MFSRDRGAGIKMKIGINKTWLIVINKMKKVKGLNWAHVLKEWIPEIIVETIIQRNLDHRSQ